MAEESQFTEGIRSRPLRSAERKVIEAMVAGKCDKREVDKLTACRVEDMQDGGMGSIRFVNPDQQKRRFGKPLVEAEYVDGDGVMVGIAYNLDEKGELYELDFWKVDFSALQRYPEPSELRLKA